MVNPRANFTNLLLLIKAAITAAILQSDSPEAQAQIRRFVWSCIQTTETQIFPDPPPEEQPGVEQPNLVESGSGMGWTPDPVEELESFEYPDPPELDLELNSESEPDPSIPQGANAPANVSHQTPGYPEQARLFFPNPQATGFGRGFNYEVR